MRSRGIWLTVLMRGVQLNSLTALNAGTTTTISYTHCYKYVQGVMSNDSLGSARWATFRNRRMTAKSRNHHKDWFDASCQLEMVNPKPCIIYNGLAMSSGGLETQNYQITILMTLTGRNRINLIF